MVNNDANTSSERRRDLARELAYFVGLVVLSLYQRWQPHEIYLGYCIEALNLILVGLLVVLARWMQGKAKRLPWAYLLAVIAFLWFPFLFSLVTRGVAHFEGHPAADTFTPTLLFTSYPEYLPWLALDLLLALRLAREIGAHVEMLFTKSLAMILRLFPSAFIALLLAALPLAFVAKVLLFHLLLAFPFVSAYRALFAPEEHEAAAEAKVGLAFFGAYVGGLVVLPFLLFSLGFIAAGAFIVYQGQPFGLIVAGFGIGLFLLQLMLLARWRRRRRS